MSRLSAGRDGRPRLTRLPAVRSAKRDDWLQLASFAAVGASGYLVNLVVFGLLVHAAGVPALAAAVAAFVVAATWNFTLNRTWTFRGRSRRALSQGVRYLQVSVAGLVVNLALLAVLIEVGVAEVPAQMASIAVVTPATFLLNRRWSF